jgi:hypothetical protein
MSFPSIDDVRRRSAADTQQADVPKQNATRPNVDALVADVKLPTLDYGYIAHVMTASPETLRAERVGAALDETRDASSGPYRVNGQSVIAQPQFRISGGAHERSHGTFQVNAKGDDFAIDPQKHFMDALTAKGHQLMTILARAGEANPGAAMLGYPTPHQLVRATQALIDAGKLPTLPPPATTADCIRKMQWDWGIGIDCVDWCMNGLGGITGRSVESMSSLQHGTDPFGWRGNVTPPGFSRADALHARPGDIVTLQDPDPKEVGHRVIVRDKHVLDANDKHTLVANWGGTAEKFLRGAGPFHVFKVDSSWGAEDGKAFGGYRCDTWVYDEGSKLWMSYSPHASDGPGVLVSGDGPAGENFVSAYRWSPS